MAVVRGALRPSGAFVYRRCYGYRSCKEVRQISERQFSSAQSRTVAYFTHFYCLNYNYIIHFYRFFFFSTEKIINSPSRRRENPRNKEFKFRSNQYLYPLLTLYVSFMVFFILFFFTSFNSSLFRRYRTFIAINK